MKVRILRVENGKLVGGTIRTELAIRLPSMQNGWTFNFDKQVRRLANATAYVLVSDETPDIIEGSLIFQLVDKKIPYMAFVEVAPHNKKKPKTYDYVAGCLIAFAFKQSLIKGTGDYKGWLTFDVSEERQEDQIKLMAVYSRKYGAVKVDETTMYILDEAGHKLIDEYLNRESDSDDIAAQ